MNLGNGKGDAAPNEYTLCDRSDPAAGYLADAVALLHDEIGTCVAGEVEVHAPGESVQEHGTGQWRRNQHDRGEEKTKPSAKVGDGEAGVR